MAARCAECGSVAEAGGACPACGALLPVGTRRRWRLVAGAALVAQMVVGGVVWWLVSRANEPTWAEASYPEGGFRVALPDGAPAARITGIRLRPGASIRGTTLGSKREEYAVLYSSTEGSRAAGMTDDAIRAEAVAAALGDAQKGAETDAAVGDFPARDLSFDVPARGVSGVARVLVVGDRVFVVVAVGPSFSPTHGRVRKFFDSFAVTDEKVLAKSKELREVSGKVALAGRPIEIAAAGKIAKFHENAAAFDPARGVLWVCVQGRPSDPPPVLEVNGFRKEDTRPHYLLRYSWPGLRLDAEYRLAAQLWSMDVGGDRLYGTESQPTTSLVAFDLKSLPPADATNPPRLAEVRVPLPGDKFAQVAVDPSGRWVYVTAGTSHKAFACRAPADLSARPEVIEESANTFSSPTVSPDGATVTYALDDLYKTTWAEVDPATWQVRRRQVGNGRYVIGGFARHPDRTFAVEWRSERMDELVWQAGLLPEVRPGLTQREFGGVGPFKRLKLTRDGRHLFVLFGQPNPALKVLRADVPMAAGAKRPVAGGIAVGEPHDFFHQFVLSPDGSGVAVTNGTVYSVKYPAE
jgi:hypothetical protein